MARTPRLRTAPLAVAALLLAGVVAAQPGSQPVPLPSAPPQAPTFARVSVPLFPTATSMPLPKIAPGTALKDLLPAAPKATKAVVYTGDDLRRVPELRFEATPEKELTTPQWNERKAHTAAAALHLNAKEEDGFLKAVLKGRADLAGVPFAMGADCRTKRPRAVAFKHAADAILSGAILEALEDDHADETNEAKTAVLRQRMMAIEGANGRYAVTYFAGISHPEATRDLARLAVFSNDKAVRKSALRALSVRREKDATAVLAGALSYPWPAVARNAAEAIVRLDRKDLMPNLVDMLEAADPRAPVAEGKKTTARELVRVNHHSNCMMCHAPAERGKVADDILVAEVPVPTEPLTPPAQGYGNTGSNLLVRIDVTYLRQDFSVMQAVDEKGAWPTMQRFDFVVRKRELTPAEAAELRDRLEKREPGVLSPYQKAAVGALREMTGRDFEAKAEPWRRHLKAMGS